ncbi:hypothetical protein [Phycisphaera mikurensis]|uniref:DUF2092 domain-containing protein n=1 Tax=Phycisphaera mikurensis (strain NBRC 102666 / KCTC 22515 / FYK2301M01) TaxID=1142394 RepID=I0IE48_PHYMF|nr:hypothetical protein [Phycisphaera mikurensis]MBB6441341.1 hypothetical protein [Phycisphaera mikurensis]BAM03536.1 hypothetical protein PSMK_13770 [Phycisphaera mikurensis NBRC 102666]
MPRLLLAFLCLPLGFAVSAASAEPAAAEAFVDRIEAAHGVAAYRTHAAVAADFEIAYPGMFAMAGSIVFDTPVGRSRMELDDGSVWVFDGRTAWVAEGSPTTQRARFHLLTWPYFFAAATKLRDPGSQLSGPEMLAVKDPDDVRPAVKLTFDAGVGDSPEDWYHAFADEQGRLDALGYIVTYGKGRAAAEESPSICIYDAFEEIDGVTVPVAWTTWPWRPTEGIVGETHKGKTRFTNVRFVEPEPGTFTKPDGATEQAAPGG